MQYNTKYLAFAEKLIDWWPALSTARKPETACTIATSIVHSKVDFKLNSLYCNRRKCQITCLRQIKKSLACVPTSCYTAPILRCLRWLKITERIDYKLLSLTCKVPITSQPHNLSICIGRFVQPSDMQHSLFISCHSRSSTYTS